MHHDGLRRLSLIVSLFDEVSFPFLSADQTVTGISIHGAGPTFLRGRRAAADKVQFLKRCPSRTRSITFIQPPLHPLHRLLHPTPNELPRCHVARRWGASASPSFLPSPDFPSRTVHLFIKLCFSLKSCRINNIFLISKSILPCRDFRSAWRRRAFPEGPPRLIIYLEGKKMKWKYGMSRGIWRQKHLICFFTIIMLLLRRLGQGDTGQSNPSCLWTKGGKL